MNCPPELYPRVLTILSRLIEEPKIFQDVSALYSKILVLLRDEGGYENSALLLMDDDGYLVEEAVLGRRSNLERRKYPMPYGCLGGGFQGEDAFLINNVELVPTAKQGSSIGTGSLLVVLMKNASMPDPSGKNVEPSEVLGAILLEDQRVDAFNANDPRLLQVIAPFISMAIEFVKSYQNIRGMVLYDELTGLHNRRFFSEYLDTEFQRAARNKQSFCIVVIDLDSLKRINDVYGHLVGDSVLKIVAQVLSSNVRSYDILARYAGDEFVLVMPDTALNEAEHVINRLMTANDQARLEYLSRNIFLPSYSYGIAAFPDDGITYEEIFSSADKRLYEAKAKKGIVREETELV